ncbi:MAG: DUF2178 domain-containing protein [Planctomycetes bacterium]|nr:DUF2178 domain-containing protein [Planctomycetota bacterium]
MNRSQKAAWLIVITTSIALIASGTAITIFYSAFGFPKASAGLGFLGIAGIGGLARIVFKKDKGNVTVDERDNKINKRAALAGFGAAYLFVGLACMTPFFVLGPDASIKVFWLPMIFMIAGVTNFYVHSIAILVQYGKGGKENE